MIVRQISIALVVAFATLGGCGSNEKEQRNVISLTQPMRTYCFGRHLLDLPASFQESYRGSSATFYYGHDADFETVEAQVVAEEVAPEAFLAAVGRRSAEIAAETNEKTRGSMLVLNEKLDDHGVLLRYHRSEISDRSHKHELHLLVAATHVLLKADSFDGVVEPVESRLKRMAQQVREVSDPQHAGRGFCLGPVVIDTDNDYEMAALHFRDAQRKHRDVRLEFSLNTFKRDESEPRLIQRAERNLSELGLGSNNPKVLRKGKAQLGGVPAEAWLGRQEEDGRNLLFFSIESYPDVPALGAPNLQLELHTGGQLPTQPIIEFPPYYSSGQANGADQGEITSSLTDGEATGLWDAIVKSVRPRQGATKPR